MKNIIHVEDNQAKVSVLDIAKFSGVQERAIVRTIRNNEKHFSRFGDLRLDKELTHIGRLLNEAETTFLLTLLKNTEQVVQFKSDLVYQFYKIHEHLCDANKVQLEQSQQNTIEAKRNAYAKPRAGNFQTVDRIRQDYNINLPTEELNEILEREEVLLNVPKMVNNYFPNPEDLRAIRQGNTTLVHEESAIEIFDGIDGMHRDNGAVDFNPALPHME